MKKITILFLVAISFTCFSQQGYRYSIVPGSDNTYAIPHKEIKAITYASTKLLAPTMEETTYNFATLTGAITVSITVTPCYTGDKMTCIFKADGSNRVVTFSAGFTVSGTLTVTASTYATVEFVFNGSKWYETTRQTNTSSATNLSVINLTVDNITEDSTGHGVKILKQIIQSRASTTYTASATVTAAELNKGVLTVSSGTVTLTLPTATQVATQIGATAGTTFDFILQNSASGGTATLAVGSGIVASGFPGTNTLTLANSATIGIAGFRLTFLSATAATLTRIN